MRKPEPVYQAVGQRIREARVRRQMTQDALATAVSLTRTSITNIEKGRQKVLLHTFLEIAEHLEVDPTTLLPNARLAIAGDARPDLPVPRDLSETNKQLIRTAVTRRKRGG